MDDQTQTVADLSVEAFTTALADAVGGSVERALEKVGAGKVAQPAIEGGERKAPEKTPAEQREERFASYGCIRDARENLYARMDPEMRKIRDPFMDGEMARWIKAYVSRPDTIGRADVLQEWQRRTEETLARATTLYTGVTGTSGLATGTAGPLIPLPLSQQIFLLRDRTAVLRPYCTVFNSEPLTYRAPVAGTATAYMVDENATTTQGEPTYTSVLLTKKKAKVYWRLSQEALDYSSINLVSLFAERAGSALGRIEDTQIATGNGTAPNFTGSLETPNVNSAGSQTITAYAEATTNSLTWEDLVQIYFALPQEWRANAVWMGNTAMCSVLSRIPDDSGRQVFAPTTQIGTPVTSDPGAVGMMLGKKVLEVPALSAGNLFFGDMSAYYILEGGMSGVLMTDQVGWANDLIDMKVTHRMDGAISNTTPFRVCAGITTAA